MNRKDIEFISQLGGFIVAVVALLLSWLALDLSKSSESKLLRLECIDKVAALASELPEKYQSMIVNGTMIKNAITDNRATDWHTDFQLSATSARKIVGQVLHAAGRYDKKCESISYNSLQMVLKLAELREAQNVSRFSEFNAKSQNEHHKNLMWIMDADFGLSCCQ